MMRRMKGGLFENQDVLMIFTLFLLFFLLAIFVAILALNTDLLTAFVNAIYSFVDMIKDFFANLGKNASDIVNTSGDVATSAGKFGIGLSNNVIHDMGNMMRGQPTVNVDNGRELNLKVEVKDKTNDKNVFRIG